MAKQITIEIFDTIGENFFSEGITPKVISRKLKEAGEELEDITVRINSPGGSAWDGITIYNMLSNHKAKVTVDVWGIAASAASIIAMAGDEIRMAENAMMMIHNASGCVCGQSQDMREVADILDKLDGTIASTYAARTGNDRATIIEQLRDETWFSAEEAVADGFATSIIPAKKETNKFGAALLSHFKAAPEQARRFFTNESPDGDDDMADIAKMTAEEFKKANPDAANDLYNSGHKDGHECGKTEARDEFASELKALRDAFPDDIQFALDQFDKGNDVTKAKAEYADTLTAKFAEKDKELSDAKAKVAELEGKLESSTMGEAGPVNTTGTESSNNEDDPEVAGKLKHARTIKNKYARDAYLASVGIDAEAVADQLQEAA